MKKIVSDPIFCRPTHDYQSYTDLWRLVELSGFPLIRLNELDATSDNVYIFSTPSTRWWDGSEHQGWPGARARIIYYNIEWYDNVDYRNIPGVEIWSADKWHAERVNARYVPLGSHEGLALTSPFSQNGLVKQWDCAMLSYFSGRRQSVYGALLNAGVMIAPNGWGEERDSILHRSKIMLQVHQHDDMPTVAPQRFALAAAYCMPVLTETLADGGIFKHTHLMNADAVFLPDLVKLWRNDGRLRDYALALHDLLCKQKTFRKNIEEALK